MTTVGTTVWKDGGAWLGYLDDHPDYWTQGEDREDLEEHLRDLHRDLTGGEVLGLGQKKDR